MPLAPARSAQQQRAAAQASDDDALMQAVAAGSQEAFAAVSKAHAPRLLALATRMLRSREEAEEVVQDALMRCWRHAGRWEPGRAKLSTWLYRITSNLVIDRQRKAAGRAREVDIDDAPEPADPGLSAEQALMQRDTAGLLDDLMQRLPPRQQQALGLRLGQELSNAEVAEIMDISVGAVELLLVRARRSLKVWLAEETAKETAKETASGLAAESASETAGAKEGL